MQLHKSLFHNSRVWLYVSEHRNCEQVAYKSEEPQRRESDAADPELEGVHDVLVVGLALEALLHGLGHHGRVAAVVVAAAARCGSWWWRERRVPKRIWKKANVKQA